MTEPRDDSPILDHDYDGIQEYDNPLPGWWKALFWVSILICVPYALYYHGAEGRSIEDDYEAEVAAFAAQLIATYGELAPDAETMLRFVDDEVAMAGMASQFRAKCAQCHRADGSGNVGPNLTDDRYVHVKKVEDLFTIISNGVVIKGMPAWRDQLSDTQRVLMAAYVASMRGQNLPGKAAEGEAIPEWSVPSEPDEDPL